MSTSIISSKYSLLGITLVHIINSNKVYIQIEKRTLPNEGRKSEEGKWKKQVKQPKQKQNCRREKILNSHAVKPRKIKNI